MYRLIYEMKRETKIRVRTAEHAGECVGQDTLDEAIISACSIDYTQSTDSSVRVTMQLVTVASVFNPCYSKMISSE